MTTLISYAVVQDFNGSVANEWEARYSQDIGNNNNIRIYPGAAYDPFYIEVDYLDISDAVGNPDQKWYVGRNSVNSGNNLQIYFEQAPASSASIYGFASVVASGTRTRTIFDSIVGFFDASCAASAIYNSDSSINGEASMSSSSGRQTNGSAAISSNGQLSANGKIIGEEWTEIPQETEVWYEN
jgi:hypothetical protein